MNSPVAVEGVAPTVQTFAMLTLLIYLPTTFVVAVSEQSLSDGNETVHDGKVSFALLFKRLTGRSTLFVYHCMEALELPERESEMLNLSGKKKEDAGT